MNTDSSAISLEPDTQDPRVSQDYAELPKPRRLLSSGLIPLRCSANDLIHRLTKLGAKVKHTGNTLTITLERSIDKDAKDEIAANKHENLQQQKIIDSFKAYLHEGPYRLKALEVPGIGKAKKIAAMLLSPDTGVVDTNEPGAIRDWISGQGAAEAEQLQNLLSCDVTRRLPRLPTHLQGKHGLMSIEQELRVLEQLWGVYKPPPNLLLHAESQCLYDSKIYMAGAYIPNLRISLDAKQRTELSHFFSDIISKGIGGTDPGSIERKFLSCDTIPLQELLPSFPRARTGTFQSGHLEARKVTAPGWETEIVVRRGEVGDSWNAVKLWHSGGEITQLSEKDIESFLHKDCERVLPGESVRFGDIIVFSSEEITTRERKAPIRQNAAIILDANHVWHKLSTDPGSPWTFETFRSLLSYVFNRAQISEQNLVAEFFRFKR